MFKATTLVLLSVPFLFSTAHGAAAKPAAAPSVKTAGQPLDQALVKKEYRDGDFDPAIAILEDFQKTHATFSRPESLMVYKYLGVMYCADQGTREKGKSYFYKLLKIEPEAKILDMYVSIVVQDIFKGTLDELMGQTGSSHPSREDRTTGPDPKPEHEAFVTPKESGKVAEQEKISEKKSTAAYWWIGGLAVAAGVAGGYYIYDISSPSKSEKDIPVKL